MRQECDFLVIGAGIAGASLAAGLSPTRKVIVLEREAQPGMHATGRSAALHTETYGNAAIRALTRASRAFFIAPRAGIAPYSTPRGCLLIATAAQQASLHRFAALEDVAPLVDVLTGAEARARVPVLRSAVVAAVFEPRALDLDVVAIERGNGRWRVMCRDGRSFGAMVVVNAAGAWGDAVAELAGAKPCGLQPLRRTAALIDAPPGVDASRWPAVIDVGEQFYFKPDAGRLLLSPADETPSLPCDAWADDIDVATAVQRVQQVAEIPVLRAPRAWAGLRTFAPDRTPVVGYDPDVPSLFWLAGQGGYGIQTSPALARVATALALGETVPSDVLDAGLDTAALGPQRLRSPA